MTSPLARRAPWIAGAAATALYALTLTPNLALAHDAAGYLAQIVSGEPLALVHPHHLLYNAVSAGWLGLVGWTGLAPVYAVALLNALAGGACVAMIVALLRDRGGVPMPLALGASAVAGVSFGLWFYSVSVEVYVIPLALLLAALYVALGPPSSKRAWAVGALHGLAMLFHQVHVLFGVVILVVLWRQRPRARPLAQAARYIAAGSVVVLAGYGIVLAAIVRPETPEAAWTWFTLYAQGESYTQPLAVATAAKALVGFVRSVVGGHFAFAIDPVFALIQRAFPDKMLDDEVFLASSLPGWVPPVLFGLAALAALGLLALLVAAVRRRGPAPGGRDLRAALAVWVGLYALFFFFWDPYNVEFWIPQTTALWMLVALGLSGREPLAPEAAVGRRGKGERGGGRSPEAPVWAVRAMWGMAALLFVVNGIGVVGPARNADNDIVAARLVPLAGEIGEGDLVVLPDAHISEAYIRLDFGAETIGLEQAMAERDTVQATAEVLARVRAARASGARVAVAEGLLRDALTPPDTTLAGPVSAYALYGP